MAEPSWTVLVSATGELGAVASRFDALQAIANAIKCDVHDLDVLLVEGDPDPEPLFAAYLFGKYVGEFWSDKKVN